MGDRQRGIESYYAAAVRSMAGSWHDFLYGSFDPNGLISLDKLPGAFWVQALSVRAFGLSVWAMVLPQVIWSVLAVLALFRAVRRIAGPGAGLAAAVVLAASPVTIASTRGNLADPLFILLLILAAGAGIRAVHTARPRALVLAGIWIGLAFQAKMTEAWLIALALALTYVATAPAGKLRKAAHLLAAGSVMVIVSLAWMFFVTATPAHSRPYVDGSMHNSVFEQVFVYNGTARFGSHAEYGMGLLAKPSARALAYARQPAAAASLSASARSRPGWDRLLSTPLEAEAGWLLPAALIIAVAGIVSAARSGTRRARAKDATALPADPAPGLMRAGLVLWGLWLIGFTAVFSASLYVLSYYLAVLPPAIAAVCAIGLKFAADRFDALRWRVMLGAVMLGTAVWSCAVLGESDRPWRDIALAVGAAAVLTGGLAVCLAAAGRSGRAGGRAGRRLTVALLGLTAAAALTGPALADGWLLAHAGGPFDAPLSPTGTFARSTPSVIAKRLSHPYYGGTVYGSVSSAAWDRVQAAGKVTNLQMRQFFRPGTWLAVYAGAASGYVLGGARHILPVGGFTGSAPFPTAARLTQMIRQGKVGWAVVPGPDDLRANDPRVQAVIHSCTPLTFAGKAPVTAQQFYLCGGSRWRS